MNFRICAEHMVVSDPKDVEDVVHYDEDLKCFLVKDTKGYKVFTWVYHPQSKPPTYIRPQRGISSDNPDSIFGAKQLHWFDPDRPYLPFIPRFDIVLRQHPAFRVLAHRYGEFPTMRVPFGKHRLDEKVAAAWDVLERWLKNMAKQLQVLGDPPASLVSNTFQVWPYPARSGYLTFEGTYSNVQRMAARTRDSFFPLIAMCSMLVFWCQYRHERCKKEGIAFDWLSSLRVENDYSEEGQTQHRTWMIELLHSFVADDGVLRVGTILDGRQNGCPDWYWHLKRVNMPICIFWGRLDELSGSPITAPDADYRYWAVRSDERYVEFYRQSPSNSDIARLHRAVGSGALLNPHLTVAGAVHTSNVGDEIMAIPVQVMSGQRRGESVEAYLRRQHERQQVLMANESLLHRQQRLQRQKDQEKKPQPGKKGPRIWYWEREEHNFRVRTLLSRGEGARVWAEHGFEQKRYDAFQNCWDICSDWGDYDEDGSIDDAEEHHDGSTMVDVQVLEVFEGSALDVSLDFNSHEIGNTTTVLSNEVHLRVASPELMYPEGLEEVTVEEGRQSLEVESCSSSRTAQPRLDVVPTSREVVDQLLSGENSLPEVEVKFQSSIVGVAREVYGFTGDAFDLAESPISVEWNVAQEALGNGRWSDNAANQSFKEHEVEEGLQLLLRGFLQRIRDHPTIFPWSVPSRIPSFDLHLSDSFIRRKSSWTFDISVRLLSDRESYHLQWEEAALSILVDDPVFVLWLIRTQSGAAYSDAASALYREGVKFHTLLRGPVVRDDGERKSEAKGESFEDEDFRGPRLGYMRRKYRADASDFLTYESARNEFLRGGKGRAAATAGGVVGRIAKEIVTEEAVVSGPEGPEVFSSGRCFFEEGQVGFWDDYLTEEEEDLVCGVYYMRTDHFQNYGHEKYLSSHRSWFPRPTSFNGSNLNLGFWSKDCEKWYQHRVRSCREPGGPDVLSASRWRDAMRYNALVPKIVKENQLLARVFLEGEYKLL
ncbi:hypothetical protein PM082_020273 [Marasmius tenuissimus]|nr:hypothetical protein PM082_020273 [Marasmius tenuissimus]